MRTKANQLRSLLAICSAAAACCLGWMDNATAQLSNAAPHSIYNPYPVNQNPFRNPANSENSVSDAAVHTAQFSEMIPDAVDEAGLGATVEPGEASGSGPMFSVPGGAESLTVDGTMTGPELPNMEAVDYGNSFEYVSEFDPSVTGEDSALLFSSSSWFRRGLWYSQQEFVMMFRGQVDEVLFGVDFQGATDNYNRPILTTAGAPLTFEPGVRLTVGKFLGQDVSNRDYTFEATFFGLLEHTGRGQLESDGNTLVTGIDGGSDYLQFGTVNTQFSQFSPFRQVPGFFQNDLQTVFYRTQFNSMEMNFKVLGRPNRDRIAMQPTGTWIRHASTSRIRSGLIGLRAVSVDEELDFDGFRDGDKVGDYNIQTSNDMVGIQLGLEQADYYANWGWGIRFKGAGLINFADRTDRHLAFDDPADTFLNGNDVNDEHLAVLLEAGVYTAYHFSPNFTGRIGYDFMYMTGIADAPNNASLAPAFSRFEVTNDAYYQGLSVGFEMLW